MPSAWRREACVSFFLLDVFCVSGIPLWSAVMKAQYPPGRVLALNGEDWHAWKQVETQHKEHHILDRATYFMRELPDSCPQVA